MELWDIEKIRERIFQRIKLIEDYDLTCEGDNAGGNCPALVSLLFIMDRILDPRFYGSIEITCKGRKTLKPAVARQMFRLDEEYKDLLA